MRSQFKYIGDISDLKVGNNCTITREPWPLFDTKGGLVFGDNVVVSSGVSILTHDHHFDKENWRDLDEKMADEPTVISDNVFIGINAIITSSCKHIGRSSVIAAGAVVTQDVPDFEIWGGNPARKIKDVCRTRREPEGV